MSNKQLSVKLCYLFSGIFLIIIGLLAILSVFIHCETNIYNYAQEKFITRHTPYIYCCLAIFGIGIVGVLCALLERLFLGKEKTEKISNGIFIFCGIIIFVAGICWIIFNDCVPASDQREIYAEAQRIAGVLHEPFNTEYFSLFPRNRGIVLFVALAIKVFGNHLYSFQVINVIASLLAYYSICKTVKMIYHNPIVTSITALFLMLFYPLFIYDSYIYGTLLSVAFVSLGLYATVALCETAKFRYAVLIVLTIPFGTLMHQSAAIGLIASIIYLLMNGERKRLLKNILVSVSTVVMVALLMKLTNITYNYITDANPNASSVPVTCTVYMGLTSTTGDAGPGSQDGSYTELFFENNCDGKAANRDALQRIFTITQEYLTGKRNIRFFLEKTEYQWLDPTFGARRIINKNDPNIGDPPNSDAFIAFYNSSFRTIVFKLSIGGMLLIYTCALIAGFKTIRNIAANPAAILIQLYVIGGFAFQLLWESFSRYCLGYFMWLIPEAAFGLYSLYRFIVSYRNKLA